MSAMELTLGRKSDEGYERFDLIGNLTASSWAQHEGDLLVRQYGGDVYTKKVMVNMAKTLHVDSTGIEWLLTCHKRFDQQGGKLVLHSVTPATQRIFQMMRMHLILNMAPNEDAARSLFTKEPA
jgi:anti-anti-sigma factor